MVLPVLGISMMNPGKLGGLSRRPPGMKLVELGSAIAAQQKNVALVVMRLLQLSLGTDEPLSEKDANKSCCSGWKRHKRVQASGFSMLARACSSRLSPFIQVQRPTRLWTWSVLTSRSQRSYANVSFIMQPRCRQRKPGPQTTS